MDGVRGGQPLTHESSEAQLHFVREASSRCRRTVGLCTGSFVLAEAGLLDGRRVTTHWAYADTLRQRYPAAQVEVDRIFIEDKGIWTSAGLTAAMDLALGIVENDLGSDLATQVARVLVMYHRRSGGQSQHSRMLSLAPKSDRVQAALEFARANLAADLTVEALATTVHLSPRQFARIFQAETGLSPAKAVEQLRVESARHMIERGRHPLEVIARENGFRDRRHLREVFVRTLGCLRPRCDARRPERIRRPLVHIRNRTRAPALSPSTPGTDGPGKSSSGLSGTPGDVPPPAR